MALPAMFRGLLFDTSFDGTYCEPYTIVIWSSYILTLLIQFLSHLACSTLFPVTYSNLPPPKRDEWNTRICSTIHALISSAFSLRVMCTEGPSLYDNVRHKSYLAPICIAITTGYLLGVSSKCVQFPGEN